MGLPRGRLNKSTRKQRASHFALKKVKLASCPQCKKPVMSHRVCSACGYYKGRDVLKLDAKKSK